jgi:hypothetical protein
MSEATKKGTGQPRLDEIVTGLAARFEQFRAGLSTVDELSMSALGALEEAFSAGRGSTVGEGPSDAELVPQQDREFHPDEGTCSVPAAAEANLSAVIAEEEAVRRVLEDYWAGEMALDELQSRIAEMAEAQGITPGAIAHRYGFSLASP